MLALAIATQQVASVFHYPQASGADSSTLARRGSTHLGPLSAGMSVSPVATQQTFDLAAMIALAVALLPAMMAIGLTRGAQRQRASSARMPGPTWRMSRGQSSWSQAGEISGRVLGPFRGEIPHIFGIEHAIIVGASRSGKGVGHVVPTLIAWPHSAFVYDRKGELWHITADHRKRFSHVFYFSPTDPNTVRWNPLFEVRKGPMEIADIQNVVGILVDPLGRKAGDLNFWDQSATDFFTAIILHVLYGEADEKKNLAQVRRLLIKHRADPSRHDAHPASQPS